uniref:Exocyst complex component 7 n=1 Tax=Esox lucius TaxID=8010 RepID=A0AAY5KYR5_ESOLU
KDQDLLTLVSVSLRKSDELTKGMVSILSAFEGCLQYLENTVIPMHDNTLKLLQLNGTVNTTLFYLDDAISHCQAVRDTDKVILQGPAEQLSDYLACLHRLKKAEEYFIQEDPDGPELNMLRNRLVRCKSQLESKFQVLLGLYSKPVQTVRILNILAKNTPEGTAGSVEELELIPQTRLQDIISISAWLNGMPLTCISRNTQVNIDHVYIHTRSDRMLEVDIGTYLLCITGFLCLAKSEHTMVSKVFPLNYDRTFEKLIQKVLDQLIQNGKNILALVTRACSHHDYSAIICQGTSSPLIKVSKLVTSIKTLVARALEEFAVYVKVFGISSLDRVLDNLQYFLQTKAKMYGVHALGLKEKDCQLIKGKFKSFNEGLEKLCKIQKTWDIPDRDLRQTVCQAQREMVSKAYTAFLMRCHNADYSKHPERFHKYSPVQVEEMIEGLFDISV